MALILVVDDETELRDMIGIVLQKNGHEVLEAGDGVAGLDLYRETQPELLVTDMMMPGGNGFSFVDTVKTEFPNAKIIAISGEFRRETDGAGELADVMNVDYTLSKPFHTHDLLKIVNKVLE